MFRTDKRELVISEADLDAALDHLRKLPYDPKRPYSWDRQHLLNMVREGLGTKPKADNYYLVAPGVFAVIRPFGCDLYGWKEPNHRLQVWLLIRSVGTDPNRIITLLDQV